MQNSKNTYLTMTIILNKLSTSLNDLKREHLHYQTNASQIMPLKFFKKTF